VEPAASSCVLQPDLHCVTFKHFIALKNALEKPSAARVHEHFREIKKELSAAVETIEPPFQNQKKLMAGIVKTAPTDKRLRTVLKIALELSLAPAG
jgi:hypothetical protein